MTLKTDRGEFGDKSSLCSSTLGEVTTASTMACITTARALIATHDQVTLFGASLCTKVLYIMIIIFCGYPARNRNR